MSNKKEIPSKRVPNGFYKDNTEEIVINGVKKRVNKFEAKKLKDKLSKAKK